MRSKLLLAAATSPLALLAAVAALRSAGFAFGLVNLDECDFWLFGRMVREGATPYLGVVDIKPPLTYAAFGLAGAVGGAEHWILSVRVLGVAVVFGTSLALRAAARVWTGDERAGWAAAWLGLAAGLCESPALGAEVLMNLPSALALYAFALASRDDRPLLFAASGGLAATAALFKQQAGILTVAMGASLCWDLVLRSRRARSAGRIAALSVGFALPCLGAALAFAAVGALGPAFDWVVTRNLAQARAASPFDLSRALGATALCLGATLLPWALALRGSRRAGDLVGRALLLCLAGTAFSVAMNGRFYEHYFLQFVPPLALLGARPLVDLVERWPLLARRTRAAVAALALAPALGYLGFTWVRGWQGGYPLQDRSVAEVVRWIRDHTSPLDRLFVWGDLSTIYCGSDRLPGTRYMRTAPHVGDWDPAHVDPARLAWSPSERDVAATLRDLAANRPAIVVDTASGDLHHWSVFPLRRVRALDDWIQAHYAVAAAPANTLVYRLR